MSLWRQLVRGLRVLTNHAAADRDLDEEAQHYLAEAAAALEARGAAPDEAARVTRLELGSAGHIREEVRSHAWENAVDTLFADLCYAARRLRRSPGFAAAAALTLALGIGASTIIFSAVDPILLEPLPYPQADRLLMISDTFEGARSDVTFHTFREVAARSRSFNRVAVFDGIPWQPTMTGTNQPQRFDGQRVSADYFQVLGVRPVLGRGFQVADDEFHGPKVVILSSALWQREWRGDPGIVGREIRLNDDLYTVLGVMPASFDNVLSPAAEIWTPLQYDPRHITQLDAQEWGHHLRLIARLRPGVRPEGARQELDRIAQAPSTEFPRPPWASLHSGFFVDLLGDRVTSSVKSALLAVSGAVVLLLLIACVNVANLLLARGAQRRGEFALRTALGASANRLTRQLLTESLLLALLGGTLAALAAQFGIRALVVLSPVGLPRVDAVRFDGEVFAFAFGLTLLAGLLIGTIPALAASRRGLAARIGSSSARVSSGNQMTRRALAVAEVSLALVLLSGAGLLLRSFDRLFAISPGFAADRLLTMQVQVSGHRLTDSDARRQFWSQALEAVRRVPGVSSAAVTSLLPFSGDLYGVYGAQFEDRHSYSVSRYVVSDRYFETIGIPIRRGRALDKHDSVDAQPVAVISESLARREFPQRNPLGQRVHIGPLDRPWYVVVGIAGDIKQGSLADTEPDAVYITAAQSWFADDVVSVIARVGGQPMAFAPAVESAIWSADKDQAIVHVAEMSELVARSAADRRFALVVFQVFAISALLLAAIGLYGVLAGGVTERTREIGIRTALGASRAEILALIVRQGIALTGVGIVIGLSLAAVATRALVTLLFGVSPLDPLTYGGVIALLIGVAIIASSVPACRAARIDPGVTLRAE